MLVENIWLGNGLFKPGDVVHTRSGGRRTHDHKLIERIEVGTNGDQLWAVETSEAQTPVTMIDPSVQAANADLDPFRAPDPR
jgi:hypothetical protein